MAIRASYIMKDYLSGVASAVITPDTIEFNPGRFSAKTADISSATYLVMQNLDPSLPSVSIDMMSITLYHKRFDELQRMVDAIHSALNCDAATDNPVLYQAGLDQGIRYHLYMSDVVRNDHAIFLEGTEYYMVVMNILYQYVELGARHILESQPSYIEGA